MEPKKSLTAHRHLRDLSFGIPEGGITSPGHDFSIDYSSVLADFAPVPGFVAAAFAVVPSAAALN